MKKLLRDSENNVVQLVTIDGKIPTGYTEVPEEEVQVEELALARKFKLEEVRLKRDAMLVVHDKLFLIALKDGTSTTSLLADRSILLDLPELAESELAALETVEDIKSYDCFSGLALNGDYE